eukprot:TRINITY_DN8660_c0_g1_i4.p1 TRINITY_DN8660_c0_g1~~TRINITY_DN8660_c0_g1_i4.p1  ORF type:complete len:607 (+),score=96.02 TRINITY_DN8660_c0_g1_i4:101-1921(+)
MALSNALAQCSRRFTSIPCRYLSRTPMPMQYKATRPRRLLQFAFRSLKPMTRFNFSQSVPIQHNSLLGETAAQRALRLFGLTSIAGLGFFAVTFPFVWTKDMEIRDMPKIFVSALTRYLRDVWAVTRIVYIYKSGLSGTFADEGAKEAMISECHHRAAAILRQLYEVNGGIYIKLGQHLGLLDYVIPQEYVEAMQGMFDAAPVSSLDDIRAVIKEDLGKDIEELFLEFSDEPLASASLAQVHRAVTKGGQEVAVKVQHRGLREESVGDVYTVAVLVEIVKRIFSEFNYTWLVEEIQINLPLELDFLQEAANSKRCASMHAHRPDVHVPTVVDELTSSRVLTMEFCHGVPLTNVEGLRNSGVDLAKVSRIVTELFSEQIFIHGFVHSDPHPGNVLVSLDVKGQPKVTLLDHGLYRELSTEFRLSYCRLWRSLLEGDADKIKEHAECMNVGELYPLFAAMLTYKPWDDVVAQKELSEGRLDLTGTDAEKLLVRTNVAKYFREINALLARVPRDVLLLLKTNDCLHGLEAKLRAAVMDTDQPQLVKGTTHVIMADYCLRALLDTDTAASGSRQQTVVTLVRYYRDQCMLSIAQWVMGLVEWWNRLTGSW